MFKNSSQISHYLSNLWTNISDKKWVFYQAKNLVFHDYSYRFDLWLTEYCSYLFVPGTPFQPSLMCEWSAWKVLHSGRLRPCPQTLDKAGKACQGQTKRFLQKFVTYGLKKLNNIGHGEQCLKQFKLVTYNCSFITSGLCYKSLTITNFDHKSRFSLEYNLGT
jgi:hypothetical protein